MKKAAQRVLDDDDVLIDLTKGFNRFPERPTPAQLEKIVEESQKTGRPEEHPDLCLASPDLQQTHLLVKGLYVKPQARPTNHLVWCAICQTWKFAQGRLMWSQHDGALRPIGLDCAKEHFEDRWQGMVDQYTLENRVNEAQEYLIETLPALGRRANELYALFDTVGQLEDINKVLVKKSPLFRVFQLAEKRGGALTVIVQRSGDTPAGFRSGDEASQFDERIIWSVQGLPMIRKKLTLSARLHQATSGLRSLRCPTSEIACDIVADMEDQEVISEATEVQRLLRRADKIEAEIAETAKFPTRINYSGIRRWATHETMPFQGEIKVTTKGLVTRIAGELQVMLPLLRAVGEE